MAPSDQTFYNIKRLHVIFAVAATALLAATVWMLAVDHGRQWKRYQRTYRDRIEPWLTEAAILAERTEAFAEKEAQLQGEFDEARKAVPEAALIDTFCREVEGAEPDGLESLRAAYQSLVEEPGAEARDKLIAELSRVVAEAKRRREEVDRQLRFRKADFNEARSGYESGVGEGLSRERLDKLADRVREVQEEVDSIGTESQKRAAHHVVLTTLLAEITSGEDAAQEALSGHRATLDRAERVLREQRPIAAKRFLSLPGIDALGSPITEPPSAARGGELFVRHGCVACHRHEDIPEAESVFGPDLSNLGSKLSSEASHRWLRSWIGDPARHSPRTRMPNALLEPVRLEGDESEPVRMTDPAADIAAFLLESSGREPGPVPPLAESDLDRLALEHLGKSFSQEVARRYLANGIPESRADEVEGDAAELLGPITLDKKVRYVGRRTIRKLGCFGCHDIPGFEDTQAIAPSLTDWGRKQESLLGFEQVHRFVLEEGPLPADESDRAFYVDALVGKRREGFAWQKLRSPRSFDYEKTQNKPYNERLAMGRFSFSDAQRAPIITFVLGLIGQAPAEKYVYQPDQRGAAIIEGRKVLDQYGCAECHTLRMDEWTFQYDPEWFEDFVGGPASAETFDFVKPHFSPDEFSVSLETDARGWERAKVVGVPYVDPSGEPIEDEDDDGNPILIFNLWEPTVIHGEAWRVSGMQVPIQEPNIIRKGPPWGGAFARLLYPRMAEEAGVSWAEAWGRVPPPLAHEGRLVRPDWLYDYLLDPVPIRPSVVLRMPKYNFSPAEAGTLVNYFAAVSGTDFPYTPHTGLSSGQSVDPARFERLENALGLVTDRTTFCAKCHLIGDFDPGGQSETILAPRLDRLGR